MLTTVIKKYISKKPQIITFDELKLFVLNKQEIIEEGIYTTKIHETSDSLSFRVKMKKGFKWNLHLHDCWEIIIVYKGICKELVKAKIINEREQIIIKPNVLHEVESLSDETILYVEFKKAI